MQRWTSWPGLWLGLGTWLYAALAVLELQGLGYDPTAPDEPDQVAVASYVPGLVYAVAALLGAALLVSAWARATGRAARQADLVLGVGLLLGGVLLWVVSQPRPVAPWLVVGAGALALAGAALPLPAPSVRSRALLGRVLLVLGAAPAVWASWVVLSDHHWQLRTWTVGYWAALVASASLMVAGLVGRWRDQPTSVWSRLAATGLLIVGLATVSLGYLGFQEGYLVSGHAESEDGWYLGGLPLFGGLGVLAGGVAATRGRWSLVAASLGGGLLVLMALAVGDDDIWGYLT